MSMTASQSAIVQRYVLRLGNQSFTLPIQVNAREVEQDEITMQLQSNNGQYRKEGKANCVNGTVQPMLTCGKREDALAILSVDQKFIYVVGGKVSKEYQNRIAAMQAQRFQQCYKSNQQNSCKVVKQLDKRCNNTQKNLITNASVTNNCTQNANDDMIRKRRQQETIVLKRKTKNNKKKHNFANSLVKAIPQT